MREPLADSWEELFQAAGVGRFLALSGEMTEPSAGTGRASGELLDRRPERAIGVIYRPETERLSHYFDAELPRQFDAVVHIDETSAVEPLDPGPGWGREAAAVVHAEETPP